MRGLLGGIILVAGVGGLGLYATQGPATVIQAQIASDAEDIAAGALHAVAVAVSGRDVTVSGVVEDDAELQSLLAAFDGISGRRVVNMDAIETLPVVSPYTLNIAKTEDGPRFDGYMPSQAAIDALGLDGLDIANGEPSAEWDIAAGVAVAALENLKTGTVEMSDAAISFTGLAATPADLVAFNEALKALPDDFIATSTIDVEDDGTPLRLSLRYDGATLSGSGKIPADMARADVAIDGAETALDVQEAVIPSPDGQWPAFAQAAIAALGHLQEGTAELDGQTVALTGTGTPDEIAAANAALAGLPDAYDARTDLVLYDDGAPFALSVAKTSDGITAQGKVPADFDTSQTTGLLDDGALSDVSIAFITDPSGVWPGVAEAGLAALAALEDGTLKINSDVVTLTGAAASPDAQAAALAAMHGYSNVTTDIALLDDGTPINLSVTYDADTGYQIAGKLPANVSVSDVAETLDMEVADAGVVQAIYSSELDLLGPLTAIQTFLPELSRLSYTATPDTTEIVAIPVPGVTPERIAGAMQSAVGEAVTVTVQPRTELPAPGTTRVNRFSGREEVFTSGYWLPIFDFFPTPENCAAQSEAVLSADQVQFVTGSAELDVPSIRAINALAALTRKCALEGGVFLQVAGHTDNTGDPDANMALSQARADAVRDAILDRGVAQVVVTAVGYGDTQPIADNDTEDGRAANRRTAFNWNFE